MIRLPRCGADQRRAGGTLVEDRMRAATACTGARGSLKIARTGTRLDEQPALHDRDAVAEVGDDAEVVRHEQHRHVALGLQVAQQIEHLGLHRHVERRGGLVGDDQVGVGRDGPGDQHALRHAARDLERIGVERALRVRDADPRRAARATCSVASFLRQAEVHAQRLDELAADRERLVEVHIGSCGMYPMRWPRMPS